MRAFSRSFSWSLWPCLKCIFPKPWIFISLLEGRSVCPHYCKVVWLLTQTGIKLHSSGVTFFFLTFSIFCQTVGSKDGLGFTQTFCPCPCFFLCVYSLPLCCLFLALLRGSGDGLSHSFPPHSWSAYREMPPQWDICPFYSGR